MSLLCKVFPYQPCSDTKYALGQTLCCHDCAEYKYCQIRCENRPSLCGKSEHGEYDIDIDGKRSRQVAKYNAETGELIAVYVNSKTAASVNELSISCLYHALRKKDGKCHGFIWRYYNGKTN